VLIVGRCHCLWVLVRGVVLGHVHRWWGGAGPLSSLVGWCWAIVGVGGVVMGHHLGGWWWALVAVHVNTLPLHSIVVVVVVTCRRCPSIVVVLGWVETGRRTMIVRHLVATSLTWHLAPGLANSKGEGD